MSYERFANVQGPWGGLENEAAHDKVKDSSEMFTPSNSELTGNPAKSSEFQQNALGQGDELCNSLFSDHHKMLTVPQVILSPFEDEENFLSPQQGLDRRFQTPTINIEQPTDQVNNAGWEPSLSTGSNLPVDEIEKTEDVDHGYLSAVENSALENQFSLSVGDKSVSLRDISRLSDHSSSPAMLKQELAVSPQVCYLTMANDDLDDILSLHSVTTENSEFVHINTMDELNAILNDSYETANTSLNDHFESLSPHNAFSSVSTTLKTPNPPHINVQPDTEDDKLSIAPSPRNSFNEGDKRPSINYLAVSNNDDFAALTDDDDLDDVHEQMRLGRKQLRRPSRKSIGSRSIDRSLSLDEKARSLSKNRDKLLELAALQVPHSSDVDPSSPPYTVEPAPISAESNTGTQLSVPLDEGESALNLSGNTRRKSLQKNPAIYSCDLCDKKFTRPYNLKSHLRTHTDERPFSCGVCGKAFARQHDRKRHEDLHSGKKRYICGGSLKDGTSWGCGKKFARSDALGRHFKTDSGRRCIAPLYDEASRERAAHNLAPPSENEQFWLT